MIFKVPRPLSVRADEVIALDETGVETGHLKAVVVTEWGGHSVIISFSDEGPLGDLATLALSLLNDSRSYEEVVCSTADVQNAQDVTLRPTAGELLPQTKIDRRRKEARVRFMFGDAKVEIAARVEHWQKLLNGLRDIA